MRYLLLGLAAAVLAGCATAPSGSGAPPRSGVGASLKLCPGVRISNAPDIDGERRIIGYDAQTRLFGATLYRAPVSACVSSGFGPRNAGAGSFHSGVDLYTGRPSPVYAGGDGVVAEIKTMRGYGKTIRIRHNRDVTTRYAHLSDYASGLRTGARVRQGETIGRTGRTGNATAVHLHYEILVNGRAYNPLTVGD